MRLIGSAALRSWLSRSARQRGLLGASRLWMIIFVVERSWRIGRWMLRDRKPVTVFSERLEPGGGLEIRHVLRRRG